jgi:4-amino-4-deoxy-L-arabinose transferase-like glycosyltransferase
MIKRNTILLIIILLVGVFLRVRLSQDQCIHRWDERFHALVAKTIWEHPLKPTLYEHPVLPYDYKKWYANHVWLHKPPLPLWIIGSSYRLFGVSEISTRIPSIFLSILVIFITYLLGKKMFSEKVGLLAAFFVSINGFIIEITSGRITTDHYDSQFMAFVLFSIFFSFKNAESESKMDALLAGLFLGCALLTKWLPALIVIPVHFCFLMEKRKPIKAVIANILILLFTALVISIPWQIYIRLHYPNEASWEQHYNWLHFFKELEGHKDSEGWMFYINRLRINYSEVIYIPMIMFIYNLLKKPKEWLMWALLVWTIVPVIVFSFAKMKLQGYILFTAPALFIILSVFFFKVRNEYYNAQKSKFLRIICGILIAAIIVIPVRYCYERTQLGMNAPRHKAFVDRYKVLRGTFSKRCVVINVSEPIEFMFYNDCVAYSVGEIEKESAINIKKAGYRLFVYNELENTAKEI